ncbi:sugar phosphate isomerase/epimerase [Candidatus Bipolaricaulota bacterium]|nr:sugar phosphate isomerase/epimerase [Candidatus Bipolaricaulota bacterium]
MGGDRFLTDRTIKMQLGASLMAFFDQTPPSAQLLLAEAVEELVALNLGIEVWASWKKGDPDPDATDIARIRTLGATAPFVSVHVRKELWRWDPQGLSRELAFCRGIGAGTLVLHRESIGLYTPSSRPDFPAIVRFAKEAEHAGVRLALKNGRDTMWALDRVLEAIGDDPERTNLGICIDVGHAHLSQDAGRQPIRNYLERYRGQLIHIHLHDNLREEDYRLSPGEGSIDWPALLQTLDTIGYSGPGVLELKPKGDPIAAIVQARDFLTKQKIEICR